MEDSDAKDGIMEATYRALCKHGYAGITMQDIADESEMSKASLHYHYDTKQDLLLGFLDYLFEKSRGRIEDTETDDPVEEIVGTVVPGGGSDEGYKTAILVMKAQSPYDDRIRRRFVEYEDWVRDRLKEAVERGVDEGVFRDVDPEETADFLVTLGNGIHTRGVTVGGTDDELRERFEGYVEEHLVAEDGGNR